MCQNQLGIMPKSDGVFTLWKKKTLINTEVLIRQNDEKGFDTT